MILFMIKFIAGTGYSGSIFGTKQTDGSLGKKSVMMTHSDLQKIAVKYLLHRDTPNMDLKCQFAIQDANSMYGEIADVYGLSSSYNVLVEVKSNQPDLKADAKKKCRQPDSVGLGMYRYYFFPKGLINGADVRLDWGILEYDIVNKKVEVVRNSSKFVESVRKADAIKYSIIRKLAKPGKEIKYAYM